MKNYIKIAIVALLMVCTANLYSQDQKTKQNKTAEVTFVSSIDCPNCVKKVEANLPHEKGVKDMKVNLENQTIWIKYQPSKTNKETLAKAIEKLGYSAVEKVEEKK